MEKISDAKSHIQRYRAGTQANVVKKLTLHKHIGKILLKY